MLSRVALALGRLLKAAVTTAKGMILLIALAIGLVIAWYVNWIVGLSLTIQVVVLPILFLLICYSFAQRGILFTLVQEGTAQAIMRGKSFDHLVMSFHGFHLNDPRKGWFKPEPPAWEVLRNTWDDFPDQENEKGTDRDLANLYDDRFSFEKILGAYYVGLPPIMKVYWYKFEWAELQLNQRTGEEEIKPRAEPTNYVNVNDFTYPAVIAELKTLDLLEVTSEYNRTVRINNPYKALFRTPEWLRRIGAATDREAKEYTGHHSYKDLQGEPSEENHESFSVPMCLLTDILPDDPKEPSEGMKHELGLKGRYGVTIVAADLRRVELSGSPEAEKLNNEAATRAYRATQEATAIRTVGRANADVILMQGTAEAKSLIARLRVIKAAGPPGLAVAQFDSLIEVSKNPGALIVEANDFGGATSGVVMKAAAALATAPKAAPTASPAQGGGS